MIASLDFDFAKQDCRDLLEFIISRLQIGKEMDLQSRWRIRNFLQILAEKEVVPSLQKLTGNRRYIFMFFTDETA